MTTYYTMHEQEINSHIKNGEPTFLECMLGTFLANPNTDIYGKEEDNDWYWELKEAIRKAKRNNRG